ncbi:proton-conducting transporter membrane subunit [Haliangium sp.]|uniref:proton-conducting transporter transmembrane domain-containing protein n=1 Tax=Haliangium sp. TaxID=2663208 RepID=UPI003D0AC118
MSTLVALPIVLPLVAAALALAARRSPRVQHGLGVAFAGAYLGAAVALLLGVRAGGAVVVQVGDWSAPFGIALRADLLAALMVCLTGVVGLAGAIYALGEIDRRRLRAGYVPLSQLLIMGVSGAFLTADLFNLFVWFEVMLLSSFVLLALGRGRAQMRGAIHYVAINLISSALFLVAVGLIYAVAHTLDMSDLSLRLDAVAEQRPWLVLAMASLLLVSFGIKAGLAPLFAWLPASYHTPPVAVSAVFAGLLTKVGVYAIIRVFAAVFPPLPALFTVILVVAGVTMIVGVLGAVAQHEVRRILGFHIVSQIGYITVGVGLLGAPSHELRVLGLTAAIFYMAHHILVKANLYLVGGVIAQIGGSERLSRLGGLARRAPWLAVLFAIPALSLAGIPPLSGFWAKLSVFRAIVAAEQYALVAVAAGASLLTLLSMLKIWTGAFWQPAPGPGSDARTRSPGLAFRIVPIIVLGGLTVAIGLVPAWLFEVAGEAARAVLGDATEAMVTSALPGGTR